MPEQSSKLDRLEGTWWQRHRRLWLFLLFAPYVLMAPLLLILALGDNVPNVAIRMIVLVCLALFVVYAAVGLVWIYRVYSAGWSRTRAGD